MNSNPHRLLLAGLLGLALSLALPLGAAAAPRMSRMQLKALEMELGGGYAAAIGLYEKDMAKKGESAASLEGIARSYAALSDFEQAEDYYARLIELEQKPAYACAYAKILLHNGKYADAAKAAADALTDDAFAEQARTITAAADSAAKWDTEPTGFSVFNLDEVNTCYSEWGVQLTGPKKMLFISDRPMEQPDCDDRPTGKSPTGGFTAQGTESDTAVVTEWRGAQMMPPPFTGSNVQVGPIAVVPGDNATLYFTRSSGKKMVKHTKIGRETVREVSENLEIYIATEGTQGWSVTPFEHNNAKLYSVMHPCLSSDGKTLYFVSNMPGGEGGLDIWMCDRQGAGWGRPANMGSTINTPGDEVFPTIGPDGTLYFSSNGHKGMGGLDIFSTKKEKGRWQRPSNLKPPFNSSADDFFFMPGKDSTGFFSSNRPGGKGADDIYRFSFHPSKLKMTIIITPDAPQEYVQEYSEPDTAPVLEEEPAPVEEPAQSIALNGKIIDADTKEPLPDAKICATHDSTKTSECKECSEDGTFSFTLKNSARYTLSAFKQGYQSTVPMRLVSGEDMQHEERVIEMTPNEKAEFRSTEAVINPDRTGCPKLKPLPREYRIQVLTNWRETDYSYFDRLRENFPQLERDFTCTKRDRITRFTYGSFVNQQEARRYLHHFISLGYGDSFIAVFEYGKQVESIFSGGSKERVAPRRRSY